MQYLLNMNKILSLTFLMCGLLNSNLNFAQVSNYSFNSSSGTYTAITGTQLIASGVDDGNSNVINIGFDFIYNGTTFTQIVANSNGCIRLGSSAAGTPSTAISTTSNTNTIAFYSRDGKTGDAVVYELTGSSPNRILTIQYSNWYPIYNSTSIILNAQIKLYETSNIVQFVYGNSTASSSTSGQVGLRGSTTITDYSSRSSSTNWDASIASSTSSSTMTLSSTIKPTSGLIYEWSPPQPCVMPTYQATNLTFSSVSSSSISGSFTAANAAPSGYLVVRSTNSTPPSPTDGITYATGSTSLGSGTNVIASGSSTTFNSSSLTSNTTYYYYVFSYNNSGCSGGPVYNTTNPLTNNVTTCLSGTPSTPTLSNETTNSMQASWSVFTGATSYRLDVSMSSSFTSYVSGYQDLAVNGTTYSITGLTSNTSYYVRIRAHNGSCPSSNSNNASRTTLKIEPTNQPTNFIAGTVTTSNIPLSWTAALAGSQGPDGYLIKGSVTSLAAITDPVDGIDNGNATSFSSGSANVKTSTSSYSSFTSQTAGTMYYYKIYSYSNATTSSTTSTTIDYKTDNVPSLYHATLPAANTTPVFSNTTSNATTISWTQPATYSNSNHSTLVFVKAGSAITLGNPSFAPSHYSANPIFTSGTPYQGDASAYCVYNGDGTNINVTGLIGNTNYHLLIITVIDATNSNGNNSYSTALTSNKTTSCNSVESFAITFEESSSLPSCTSFLSTDGLGANINTLNPYQGTKCLGLQSTTTFILPNVNNAHLNTHKISFYARTAVNTTGTIGFGYLSDPLNAATYVNLQSFTLNSNYQFCSYEPINNIPQNATLAIKMLGSAVLRVDNIVWEIKPNIVWSSQTWSNMTGPTSFDNADIDDNLITTSDLNCKDLTINSGKTLTIAAGHSLNITGNLLNNGQIIFKSDATGSGMFDQFTGTITGNGTVQVERYIPAKRAFRFVSSPVTTTTTILQNWQENGGTTVGLGTHITGTGGATNGFDATGTNNASMFTFDNGSWVAVANTNVNVLTAGTSYRLMVRGDRTTDLTTNSPTATSTTLRATGTLKTGNFVPTINQTADGFSLVGNPYQAPIDIKAILTASSNMSSAVVYYWDPTLNARGGYVTRNLTTNVNDVTSSFNQFVQPGQTVFIKRDNTANVASVTISESHKSVANGAAGVFRTSTPNDYGLLRVNLQANTNNQWQNIEGTLALFNDNFSWNVTPEDATKMSNLDEEVSFVQNNTSLAISCVSAPSVNSELPIQLNNLRHSNYQWQFELANYQGERPYLFDTQNNTYTEITNGTTVPFTVTTTAANRFKIVFQPSALNTDDFANGLVVYPNPAKAGASFYIQGISAAQVSVHNVLGQQITVQVKSQGNALQVTPSQTLSQGIYLVTVTTEGKIQQVKWIVE